MQLRKLNLLAHAKINLSLDVPARLESGYHCIRSVIAPISLADKIAIEWQPGEQPMTLDVQVSVGERLQRHIDAHPDQGEISAILDTMCSRENLVCKAWQQLEDLAADRGRTGALRVSLVKQVPFQAGLGGGSADAAAVLNGVNSLLDLGLNSGDLAQLGAAVGSDVPALVFAQPVFIHGIGEKYATFSDSDLAYWREGMGQAGLVIAKAPGGSATSQAYQSLNVQRVIPDALATQESLSEALLSSSFHKVIRQQSKSMNVLTFAGREAKCGVPKLPLYQQLGESVSNDFQKSVASASDGVMNVIRELGRHVRIGARRRRDAVDVRVGRQPDRSARDDRGRRRARQCRHDRRSSPTRGTTGRERLDRRAGLELESPAALLQRLRRA